jgi:putative membrane protein
MQGWGWGWGPGWWIVGSFLWIVFWVVVIVVLIGLLRGRRTPGEGRSMTPALRILEERYAKGEISREEFLERRSVLSGTGPAPPPPGTSPAGPGEPTQPL